jgi:hypothetical protein
MNKLKSDWEKELYMEVCTCETRRGIRWWKMGIWRSKGVRGNIEQGMCPICSEEEGWRHLFRCEGTRRGRDELVDKGFTSTDPENAIRRIVENKNKEKLQKIGLFLSQYEEKWKRSAKKYEDESVTN